MRLNLFLARAAGGSRREADGWIRDGRVRVNGEPLAGLGVPVDPDRDRVTLDGRRLELPARPRYLAYHKPRGLLVSRRGQGGKPTVFEALGDRVRGLHAVGRLDFHSEGLLLLTDDGALSEALLHPRSRIVRRYRVWVRPVPDATSLRRLQAGAVVEDARVRPLRVVHEGVDRGSGVLRVDLAEGRKREIRVLARAAGLEVDRLLRTEFGPVRLGTLRPGALRPLTPEEVRALHREAFRGHAPGARLR